MDKINFENLPSTNTPLTAERLNQMQTNIDTQKAESTIVSDAYDSTQTYDVGDYCIYNNALYKCTTAISTAEEFNSVHWIAVKVSDELNNKLDKVINVTTAGTSCNDYLDDGIYWFGTAEVLPSDSPVNGIYGWLEVIAGQGVIRQIWHRSGSINSTNMFQTYVRIKLGGSWSSWGKYVTRNEIDELEIDSDKVSGGTTWSKTLSNGTYLIVLTRTNGATSAGLYIANINNYSFLTTVSAYYGGAGVELTLSDKTVSITPNAVMTATVVKLTGR